MADYFVQKRENDNYIPRPDELTHVQETLQLLHVMTGNYSFETILNDETEKGAVKTMCDVLDRAENRGMLKGIQIGLQRGTQQGMQQGMKKANREALQSLIKNLNWSPIQAMNALDIPESDRSTYFELLKQ